MEDESSSVIVTPPELATPRYGLRAASTTHLGLRHEVNEDSHAVARTSNGGALFLVCDGMGGMGRGDQASKLALERLKDWLCKGQEHPLDAASAAIHQVDRELARALDPDANGKRPGTTCAVVHVEGGVAYVTWVGDSSVFLLRDGAVVAKTRPHRVVQDLIDAGAMSFEEARTSPMRRFLARSLGGRDADEPVVEPSMLRPWRLVAGDTIVVCSDGLSDFLTPDEIAAIALRHDDEAAACEALVAKALEREVDDNVSVIVARCVDAAADDDDAGYIAPAWDHIDQPLGAFDEPDYHSDIRVADRAITAPPREMSTIAVAGAVVVVGGMLMSGVALLVWLLA